MQRQRTPVSLGSVLLGVALCAGCGQDAVPFALDAGRAARAFDAAPTADAGAADAPGADGAAAAGPAGDAAVRSGCDEDGDGVAAESCGGRDCDDGDPGVLPGAAEACSFVDENCDGANNEGLPCAFIASSDRSLYLVDPFAGRIELLTEVQVQGINQSLLDIDIDPAGTLLGVTDTGIYELGRGGEMTLLSAIDTPFRTNGLAIDSAGVAFVTNADQLVEPGAYRVALDGSSELTLLGRLTPYRSSGDCVKLKDDSLLMSSIDPSDPAGGDVLVFVDSVNARSSLRGGIGFDKVWGLSASWGHLFGVTGDGEVIEIDPRNGLGTLLFSDPTLSFWGAANGD